MGEVTHKECLGCGETKLLEDFHKNHRHRYGRNTHCKVCKSKQAKERYANGPNRDSFLRRTYGITLDEYDEMLESQGSVCAICGGTPDNGRRMNVDHDHDTGKIRGLLCNHCNPLLGNANDNPYILRLGAMYLEKHARR